MATWTREGGVMSESQNQGTKQELVVSRVVEAPVEKVWKAWTDHEYVKRWWGPEGFTAPVAKMNVREGGTSLVCMRSPEGQDYCNIWTYRNIVPYREIDFVQSFADEHGNKIDPEEAGLPAELEQDVRTVVTLEPVDDNRTEVRVVEYGWPEGPMRDMSQAGLEQTLDKLGASLVETG
jgi:uncharacterized protein YndB with AHSA1/START domain